MNYEVLLIIPLLFGGLGDWQASFCNIGIVGIDETLSCDKIKDTLLIQEGPHVSLDLDQESDTLTIGFSGGEGPNDIDCANGFIKSYDSEDAKFSCGTVNALAVQQEIIQPSVMEIYVDSQKQLFPQYTLEQRNNLNPSEGFIIYNLDFHKYQYFNGNFWESFISG